MKLRTKLTLAFFAITAIPIVIVYIAAYYYILSPPAILTSQVLRITISVAVFLILLLSVAVSFLLGWFFSDPISHFTRIIKDFAEKTFNVTMNEKLLKSQDEISVLSSVFDMLSKKNEELHLSLKEQVEDQTRQLQSKIEEHEETKKAMVNILEDIQREKGNADNQRRLVESVMENLPVGVLVTKATTGEPVTINSKGIELLGGGFDPHAQGGKYTELFFKDNGDIYPQKDLPLSITLQKNTLVSKEDLVIQKPEGPRIMLRATSAPVKNKEGITVFAVVVYEDITKAYEVDRMKTEFISLASHQLRTPLSAMRWFLEMLMNGDAGDLLPEQKQFIKNVEDSNNRMIDLVNSLLNVSRMESGRIMINPRETHFGDLVKGVIQDIQVKLNEKKQQFITSIRADLPTIKTDPDLLRNVYLNLLTNAIKYTPEKGEITIFISRKGNDIITQITDTGYGIPKSEQPKLFQKFFRATNIIKKETDGNGLGMYLVKAIMEALGGKIWFKSEENKGTTFWLSLPMTGSKAKKGEVTINS